MTALFQWSLRSGEYDGPEAERLAALKWAAMLGAAYVDVELESAKFFFGGTAIQDGKQKKIIQNNSYW